MTVNLGESIPEEAIVVLSDRPWHG